MTLASDGMSAAGVEMNISKTLCADETDIPNANMAATGMWEEIILEAKGGSSDVWPPEMPIRFTWAL